MDGPALIPGLHGVRRRVVYVSIYELIAIAVATLGWHSSPATVWRMPVMAVVSSGIAVAWNFIFNTFFERWEARQVVRGAACAAVWPMRWGLRAGWCSRWCRCLPGGSRSPCGRRW